jgi:hypothetical protein
MSSFIDKLPRYLANNKGLNLILRFVQYFSRLLDALGLTRRFMEMSSQISLTRKVLRVGVPLAVSLRIIRRFQAQAVSLLGCCEAGSEISALLYLLCDHLLLLHKLGLFKLHSLALVETVSSWSSLVETILSLVVLVVDIASGNRSFGTWLDLWTTILELPIVLDFLAEGLMSPVLLYASGSVTAVMSALQLWITL